MKKEPIFVKCCLCVPLRVCLQIWAWFKLLADLTASLYFMIAAVLLLLPRHYQLSFDEFTYDDLFTLILFALLVDFCFVTLLIVGLFKKNYSALRVFFYYGIYMILAEATIMIMVVILPIANNRPITWADVDLSLAIFVVMGLFWIVIDIFMVLTLKSEMIKIQNKEQYDFIRMPKPEEESSENIKNEDERTDKYYKIEEEKHLQALELLK